MSISSILNIAKNSLNAVQISIQTTSHNIANVNTEGYMKQTAIYEEETPSPMGIGLLGNGVKVSSVKRHQDVYLEIQITKKNNELEEHRVYQKYYERLESILNEDNNKLTDSIVNFFNEWQELSTDPQSVAIREGLKGSGQALTRSIRNIYDDLKGVQLELNNNVSKDVQDINRITSSLAELNSKIFEGSKGGSGEANDYINRQVELLKELSGKIGIITFSDSFGRTNVLTSQGKVLVDGGKSWQLATSSNTETGFFDVHWVDFSGSTYDITNGITGGSLRAYIQMQDHGVSDFIDTMDKLAENLISEVNAIHKNGYTLNHEPTTPDEPDGIAFFKEITTNFSKDFDLSDAVKQDTKNIAAASETDSTTGVPMGNGIALQIATLVDKNIFDNGRSTVTDFTVSITSKIGQLTRGAKDAAQFSEDIMGMLQKQREGVSGVSIDEEMADLIKFQYAYQASSRLFTVADELFRTLLEAVR